MDIHTRIVAVLHGVYTLWVLLRKQPQVSLRPDLTPVNAPRP